MATSQRTNPARPAPSGRRQHECYDEYLTKYLDMMPYKRISIEQQKSGIYVTQKTGYKLRYDR